MSEMVPANVNIRVPSVPVSVIGPPPKGEGSVSTPEVTAIGSAVAVGGAASQTAVAHAISWRVRLICSSFLDEVLPGQAAPRICGK